MNPTSFPFLAIAREHGIPYREVLLFLDRWETAGIPSDEFMHQAGFWKRVAIHSALEEKRRRLEVINALDR